MTNYDARLRELKAARDAAERDRIRAETQRDAARAQADTARAYLRDEFGVDSSADAELVLNQLRQQLEDEMDAATAELAKIEEPA